MTMSSDPTKLIFDRRSGRLTAPTLSGLLHARTIQLSHRLLAPFGYVGVSRIHNVINKLMAPKTQTTVVDEAGAFSFPSNDYYWNRLLDRKWSYEPELDYLLRRIAKLDYVFLDLGSNFGFWSVRVSSEAFGNHPVIAVEASSMCFAQLERNVAGLNHVKVYHRAIDSVSGKSLRLYGKRHAGFSIDQTWYGASDHAVNEVETISIDDLALKEGVMSEETSVVVKLDVEGVELRALQGARGLSAGRSAFLIEDAEFGKVSDAVQFACTELGMKLYHFDGKSFGEVTIGDILRIKASSSKFQATGLNLIATASPFWWDHIEKMESGPAR